LHFSHPDVALPFLEQNASLKFLAVVETTNVPLYLVAGPSLDIWTSNERTEQWLHQCLFDDLKDEETEDSNPWWKTSGGQSHSSILLSVRGGHNAGTAPASKITEILLYAAASSRPQENEQPPTPPASSSPVYETQEDGVSLSVRIHALPLSSKIYSTLTQAPAIPQVDSTSNDPGFYYLPSPPEPRPQHEDEPPAKRLKKDTIFDEATQFRRLRKKQGGEGIAKAMAAMDARMAMPALSSSSKALPEPRQNLNPRVRTPFSRASTTGCINPPQQTNTSTSRPNSSHQPPLPKTHRSSLSRAQSVLSPSIDESRNSEVPEPSTLSENEQVNKAALSRVIMAGMRMYGLQQQHQRRKSVGFTFDIQNQAPSSHSSMTAGGDEEFKAVYHQTFKATAFAFRNQWKMGMVGQEVLRGVVDVFLGEFCGAGPALKVPEDGKGEDEFGV
ncbi:MAG: hypothetical protein Q9168_008196, partial [Polycauliona sp. 1 TL-2023]